MADLRDALATVLDDEQWHDCATVKVRSSDGKWTLQFANGDLATTHPLWNVAGKPPQFPGDDWDVIESEPNDWISSGFAHVRTDAETADDAVDEALSLITEVGGYRAEIYSVSTVRMGRSSITGNLLDTVEWAKRKLERAAQ